MEHPMEAFGSRILFGPAWAITVIWEVNQWVEAFFLFLSASLIMTFKCSKIDISENIKIKIGFEMIS